MSLWASSYSEVAVTENTKQMLAEVETITASRLKLAVIAGKGTGKGLGKVGGFLGIGAKAEVPPPPSQLKAEGLAAIAEAKAAYNRYVGINNIGIPLEINPLTTI